MSELIPHRPQRGIIPLDPGMAVPRAVTFREGPALVTYHAPRYALWEGRPALDLGLPVLATWTAGDGTRDRPLPVPGGAPAQAPTERAAA